MWPSAIRAPAPNQLAVDFAYNTHAAKPLSGDSFLGCEWTAELSIDDLGTSPLIDDWT